MQKRKIKKEGNGMRKNDARHLALAAPSFSLPFPLSSSQACWPPFCTISGTFSVRPQSSLSSFFFAFHFFSAVVECKLHCGGGKRNEKKRRRGRKKRRERDREIQLGVMELKLKNLTIEKQSP